MSSPIAFSSSAAAAASGSESPFPSGGLLPKAETGVVAFLAAHPEADGRGVTVAIFDTGCDPAAAGLLRTSTGQSKYADFFDASGSGDVDTSTVVEAAFGEDGFARFASPLSGRFLAVPSARTNPTGKWRVGVKRAYELYPAPLVARMKAERRKVWDEQQRQLEQQIARRLASWDEDAKAATTAAAGEAAAALASPSSASSYPATFTAKDKADLEARLAEVKAASTKFDDPGPIFDCLVWHTGTPAKVIDPEVDREVGWFAMIDSTCTGDFSTAKPLTHYRDSPDFSTFSGVDMMHYTVNIYSGGKTLSIVTTAGSHGTHVAGIVAAYEGATPELAAHNGIAPGARLVSIKIGDNRLGSMETGVGLVRGLIEAIRLKVDVINMSYGEASSIPNSGRVSELIRSAIFDHGIIFVSSAGNNGPGLSSAGSPGGTDTGVISVGAYVSPIMSQACYSSRKAVIENQYSWSSRGPTTDGAPGVTISACGAAVTSVCNWQLQKSQLMNGTSMSSPAAAGGIALLCSGLKARGIAYTPQRIKNAIENTARTIERLDPLTLGCGLLQVQAAFDHLVANAGRPELDLLYRVTIPAQNARGIYLRDAADSAKAHEATVQIEAVFRDQRIDEVVQTTEREQKEDDSAEPSSALTPPAGVAHPHNYAGNKSRIDFIQKIEIVCEVDYIDAPAHLVLMHGGRSFSVVVHGERLAPGVHYTELLGFDTAFPRSAGPVFRVPVTVLKVEDPLVAHNLLAAASVQMGGGGEVPHSAGSVYKFANLPCDSGTVHRRFVTVPEGAQFVDFRVTAHSLRASEGADAADAADPQRGFMFHALYLQNETAFRDHECNSFFQLNAESPSKELRMDVRPGQTLEVCLSQYWSSIGPCSADVDVSFQGLDVECGGEVVVDASTAFHAVHYRSVLRSTKLAPSASLKTWNTVVKPSSAVIAPLTKERDFVQLGSKLLSSLILTYNFELKDDSSCVKVRAPALNERLYESAYESQLTQIFDANKRFQFATDAFESGKALKSGKYTARIQVRHDDVAMLEKLKDSAVVVETALAKAIDLAAYASYPTAVTGGAKFGANKVIKAGKSSLLYLSPPDAKAYPSGAKPGDWASGQLQLIKNEGVSEKGGCIPLRLYAPAHSDKPASPKKDAPKADAAGEAAAGSSPVASSPTAAASSSEAAAPAPAAAAPSTLATELRDLTITHLSKLKSTADTAASKTEALSTVLPPLLAQFPTHLPLLYLELRFLHELAQVPGVDRELRTQVLAKADALLTQHIDQQALLAHFGRLIEKDDTAGQALRKEKEEVRKTLIKTLTVKLEVHMARLQGFKAAMRAVEYQPAALKELEGADEPSDETFASTLAAFNSVWAEISQWIDVHSKDGKAQFSTYIAFQHKLARQYGTLLKALNADLASAEPAAQKQLLQDKVDLLSFLSDREGGAYHHLVRYLRDTIIIQFPKEFGGF